MHRIPAHFSGPGLVDLQLNGYSGFDFNSDVEDWSIGDFRQVSEALKNRGVVAALPTIITDGVDAMLDRARMYSKYLEADAGLAERFPGLHLEGPFIASDDGPRGAHPKDHCLSPSRLPDFLSEAIEASGNRIAILTVAPELDGSIELIEAATDEGICVGLGHTQASPSILKRAVQAGAKLSTHLGNGSHQLLPRHANYIQAQLADDSLVASFIADGHHIPFYALKNFIRAKRPHRSVLVTDAIAAADIGPGKYKLGDDKIVVRDDLYVSKPGEPNMAGSALTLDRAILNVVRHCDVTFETAWEMASTLPASLIGMSHVPEITVGISDESFRLSGSSEEQLQAK